MLTFLRIKNYLKSNNSKCSIRLKCFLFSVTKGKFYSIDVEAMKISLNSTILFLDLSSI